MIGSNQSGVIVEKASEHGIFDTKIKFKQFYTNFLSQEERVEVERTWRHHQVWENL